MPNMKPRPTTNILSTSKFVDAQYLAAKYHVTSRYILQLATAEKIPCLRIGKKCVRFDPDAVAKAIGDESHHDKSNKL